MLLPLLLAVNLDWVSALGGRVERNAAGDVTALSLRSAFVSDSELDAVAAMPALEKLDLSLTRVTDLGLLRLKNLKNVRELNLLFAELVTDEGLAAVKTWPRIERLNFRGTKVTDNTLALLAGKNSITALDIGFAECTDSGLQHLTKLKGLRELAFGGNKMTEVGLEVLRSLPNLTHLDLAGKQRTDSGLWFVTVTDVGLDPVATLSALRSLNLAGTLVTARGLEKLKTLTHLERLNLAGAKRVNDAAVPMLAAMSALRWVDLKDSGMTAAGFAALKKARADLRVAGDPADEPVPPRQVDFENEQIRIERIPPPGPVSGHIVIELETAPPVFANIDVLGYKGPSFKVPGGQPGAAENFQRVLTDNKTFRVTRLACVSRANCPANEFPAVDVALNGAATLFLRKGAAPRFNETPLPLDLVRIELKRGEDDEE